MVVLIVGGVFLLAVFGKGRDFSVIFIEKPQVAERLDQKDDRYACQGHDCPDN